MMNEPEIFAATESLAAAMVQRGLRTPEVSVMAQSGNLARVWLSWSTGDISYNDKVKIITGGNLADACRNAAAWIAALPTPETRANLNLLKGLSDVIEAGLRDGASDRYMAPLYAPIEAMRSNLLAAPVAS